MNAWYISVICCLMRLMISHPLFPQWQLLRVLWERLLAWCWRFYHYWSNHCKYPGYWLQWLNKRISFHHLQNDKVQTVNPKGWFENQIRFVCSVNKTPQCPECFLQCLSFYFTLWIIYCRESQTLSIKLEEMSLRNGTIRLTAIWEADDKSNLTKWHMSATLAWWLENWSILCNSIKGQLGLFYTWRIKIKY